MKILKILEIPIVYAQGSEDPSVVEEKVFGIVDFFVTNLPNWILALIIVFLSIILAKFLRNYVENKMLEHVGGEKEQQGAISLASRTTYWGVMILGFTMGLSIAGLHVETLVAAVGLGISFALKDLFTNFVAGVMILLARQFNIGDMIKVDGTIGKVEEIQSRATILKAIDGTKVIMPNTKLFTKKVTSLTSNPVRRIEVPISIAYKSDLNKAATLALQILSNHADILKKPSPAVLLSSMSEKSMDFKVRFWVSSHSAWLKTKSDVIALIKQTFDQQGIEIPFPSTNVILKKEEKVRQEEVKAPPITEEKPEPVASQADGAEQTPQGSEPASEGTEPASEGTEPASEGAEPVQKNEQNPETAQPETEKTPKAADATMPGADFMAQA